MNRRPTDSSDVPARERGRLGRSLPVLAGAVIAAAGLALGSLTAVRAAAGHGGPPSIKQQAAKVRAQDAYTPKIEYKSGTRTTWPRSPRPSASSTARLCHQGPTGWSREV
jgi:hypothetical protein